MRGKQIDPDWVVQIYCLDFCCFCFWCHTQQFVHLYMLLSYVMCVLLEHAHTTKPAGKRAFDGVKPPKKADLRPFSDYASLGEGGGVDPSYCHCWSTDVLLML